MSCDGGVHAMLLTSARSKPACSTTVRCRTPKCEFGAQERRSPLFPRYPIWKIEAPGRSVASELKSVVRRSGEE